MTSVDEDVRLPANWADSVEEDLYEDDSPHTQSQVGMLTPEHLLLNILALHQHPCLLLPSWQSACCQIVSMWLGRPHIKVCPNFRQQNCTWGYAYAPMPYNMLHGVRHEMKGMSVQAWPPLPSHTQPLTSTPEIGQAPSQGGGQVTSAAAAAAAAAMPPTRQEALRNSEGATESHTSTNVWADPEAVEVCSALLSGEQF